MITDKSYQALLSPEVRLSIITINYNNLQGLKKTMQSVFAQTFTDFEYIIIDGASTDGSKELIEQYADKLSYWVSEPDKGIYDAMNKGWQNAKGEFCIFLNSGDYLIDNGILKIVSTFIVLDEFRADVYYGDLIMQRTGEHPFYANYPEEMSLSYFVHDSAPHPASFIKHSLLLENNGYSEDYKVVSDWLFFMRVWLRGAKFKHMPFPISFFNLEGISTNTTLTKLERNTVFHNEFAFLKSDLERLDEYKRYSLSRAHRLLSKLVRLLKTKIYFILVYSNIMGVMQLLS